MEVFKDRNSGRCQTIFVGVVTTTTLFLVVDKGFGQCWAGGGGTVITVTPSTAEMCRLRLM